MIDYTKTVEMDPNNFSAYANRGITYYNLEDYHKALIDYTKAIMIDPKNSVISNYLANIYK